jgi:hypothetical protein
VLSFAVPASTSICAGLATCPSAVKGVSTTQCAAVMMCHSSRIDPPQYWLLIAGPLALLSNAT